MEVQLLISAMGKEKSKHSNKQRDQMTIQITQNINHITKHRQSLRLLFLDFFFFSSFRLFFFLRYQRSGLLERQTSEVHLTLDENSIAFGEIVIMEHRLTCKFGKSTCNVHVFLRSLEGGTGEVGDEGLCDIGRGVPLVD